MLTSESYHTLQRVTGRVQKSLGLNFQLQTLRCDSTVYSENISLIFWGVILVNKV